MPLQSEAQAVLRWPVLRDVPSSHVAQGNAPHSTMNWLTLFDGGKGFWMGWTYPHRRASSVEANHILELGSVAHDLGRLVERKV